MSNDRFVPAGAMMLRHWDDESTAVVRLSDAGTTHLIAAEALAIIQALTRAPRALASREIAHALGLVGDIDAEIEAGLQRIIQGLVQSGLLHQVNDDAEPGGEQP